jgi:hypothetical protein
MRRRWREHSLLLKASKIIVSLGASVNLTSATGGERYGHFRAPVARSVSAYHLRSNRESAPMKTASLAMALFMLRAR